MTSNTKICITGGGSGGHLNTALGVIEFIQAEHSELAEGMLFIGGTRGMIGDSNPSLESQEIPKAGIRFIPIRSGKLHRKLSVATFKLLGGVLGGFVDAWKVLRFERPTVILSTGGYVTVPVVIWARFLGIPTLVHEQTITAGLANKIAGRFADKVLLTFPDSQQFFPAEKTVVVGNVVRGSRMLSDLPTNLDPEYAEFLMSVASSELPFIFLTGGGLGSHKLNAWAEANLVEISKKFKFLIQTGNNQVFADASQLRQQLEQLPTEQQNNVHIIERFGDEIGYIYHHADVVICRSGANTVLELLATERKAVLVPIDWSSGGEQLKNAEYFVQNQAGEIVSEADTTKIMAAVDRVLLAPTKPTSKQFNLDAAESIYREMEDCMNQTNQALAAS